MIILCNYSVFRRSPRDRFNRPETSRPEVPRAPFSPWGSEAPEAPEAPEMPGVPVVPEVPELPEMPDVPDVPDAPPCGPLPGLVPPDRRPFAARQTRRMIGSVEVRRFVAVVWCVEVGLRSAGGGRSVPRVSDRFPRDPKGGGYPVPRVSDWFLRARKKAPAPCGAGVAESAPC